MHCVRKFVRLDRPWAVLLSYSALTTLHSAAADTKTSLPDREVLPAAVEHEFPGLADKVAKATGIKLVLISPGTFLMGSPDGSPSESGADEHPQTKVTLTKPYWLGATDVTQSQFLRVMGENPSVFKGSDNPVDTVTWVEAFEYCQKLTDREKAAGRLPQGYAYRLPTEAQWEYACRAGTSGAQYGNLDEVAWYSGNSNGTTHPVGRKQPNAWGLYDMVGNISQWCLDWLGNYPGGSVSNPVGPSSGSVHIKRGGSWGETAYFCSYANRGGDNPDVLGHSWIGFRLALAPSQ
jgi:formylglycine-generating enzyme required for sulfatase activity